MKTEHLIFLIEFGHWKWLFSFISFITCFAPPFFLLLQSLLKCRILSFLLTSSPAFCEGFSFWWLRKVRIVGWNCSCQQRELNFADLLWSHCSLRTAWLVLACIQNSFLLFGVFFGFGDFFCLWSFIHIVRSSSSRILSHEVPETEVQRPPPSSPALRFITKWCLAQLCPVFPNRCCCSCALEELFAYPGVTLSL